MESMYESKNMNSIKSNFVSYQIALDMKKLGFDELCFGFYTDSEQYRKFVSDSGNNSDLKNIFGNKTDKATITPTYFQAFRFFSDNYNLEGLPQRADDYLWYKYHIYKLYKDYKIMIAVELEFKTYEEAQTECLKELIKIVNENKEN
jgi:hypothetical protein